VPLIGFSLFALVVAIRLGIAVVAVQSDLRSLRKVTAPVTGTLGGLHEGNVNAQTLEPDVQFLKDMYPAVITISPHDSSPGVLAVFQQAFPTAYQPVQVGEPIRIR
jgi:metal-dependent hydrolase (beta-lactamase superfamily II)